MIRNDVMIIRYINGQELEGVLLSQAQDSMRVGLREDHDVLVLNRVGDRWATDDCEPVHVEFPWSGQGGAATVTEEDCICSPRLAARLRHLLLTRRREPAPRTVIRREIVVPVQPRVF
jgi:hypothetical protein